MKRKISSSYIDTLIFVPFIILNIVGLLMVWSVTSVNLIAQGMNGYSGVIKQLIFFAIGLGLCLFTKRLNHDFLSNPRLLTLSKIACFAMMVATFIPHVGVTVNGSNAWLNISVFTFQPIEIVKIGLILWMANDFVQLEQAIADGKYGFVFKKVLIGNCLRRHTPILKRITQFALSPVAFLILSFCQKDMGNMAICALIIIVMIGASGIRLGKIFKYLAPLAGIGFIGFWFLKNKKFITVLPNHIQERVMAWIDPFEKSITASAGWQLKQGMFAISNGGLRGAGLGRSIEKRGYLPEAENDFVFTILSEEFGAILASLVLLIITVMIGRMYKVAIRAKSAYNSMVMIGLGSFFLIQVFINVGGVIGLIPSTGVVFPFVSQGGTSLVILSLAIGIALNVSADEKIVEDFEVVARTEPPKPALEPEEPEAAQPGLAEKVTNEPENDNIIKVDFN
ncbi:MAG: FtsW/RodA/SpoVE family cell cycle protein [Lactobacillales bacterium]|jgi:cell division protein FtsW|nr:FtsW/RodA/SpoVE family cell cycle protein [Lactobacillales bacterium]